MAKSKRVKLGSIVKNKDPNNSDYIKLSLDYIGGSVTLKDGQYLNVETKDYQKKSLKKAMAEGRLTEEHGNAALARLEKMPDFVRAEVFANLEEK